MDITASVNKAISDYFDGWERYGIKQEDGSIESFLPDEMPVISICLAGEDVFIGPAEEVASYYMLQTDISKNELAFHRNGDAWKSGRMIVKEKDSYSVWVRYDEPVGVGPRPWTRIGPDAEVVYCDRELSASVNKTHKFTPILDKLSHYFGSFEFGVYKEATDNHEGKVWAVDAKAEAIGYLRAMNAQGNHVFIRPKFDVEAHFMMHDDVDEMGLAKYHKDPAGHWKPGRLVVESSPGNYQVWIKSARPLSVEEKKHWLDQMRSDPGAAPRHRWGRCPGFRNKKAKYQTAQGHPLARLCWIDWRNKAGIPAVEIQKESGHTMGGETPLRGKDIVGVLPTRDQYFKGEGRASEQDFAYMLALIRRGVGDEEIKQRILTEREDWEHHKGPKRMEFYLNTSLKNARGIVEAGGYRIDVIDSKKKVLTSRVVERAPAGKDHMVVLSQAVQNLVVREGLDPKGITVNICPVQKGRVMEKAMDVKVQREKAIARR